MKPLELVINPTCIVQLFKLHFWNDEDRLFNLLFTRDVECEIIVRDDDRLQIVEMNPSVVYAPESFDVYIDRVTIALDVDGNDFHLEIASNVGRIERGRPIEFHL